MAFYKTPCVRCGALIEANAHFCPDCGTPSPFGERCPACLRPVQRTQRICAGCRRPLFTACPHCGRKTFAGSTCESCGSALTVKCANPRCKALQFFENIVCTACGRPLKTRK